MLLEKEGIASIEHTLPEPKTLQAGEDLSIIFSDSNATEAIAKYRIHEDKEMTLLERRVDVGMFTVVLAIDTDIQPHETFPPGPNIDPKSLKLIQVEIRLEDQSPEIVALKPTESVFESSTVQLLVPLDRYLYPDQRVLDYQITFTFEDGSELKTDLSKHEYSDTNVTVRRQQLQMIVDQMPESKGRLG